MQWQVSTDGGVTYSNIAGATSTTLTFITSLSENGYLYRAVFRQQSGHRHAPPAALLTVESDSGDRWDGRTFASPQGSVESVWLRWISTPP